jgi:Trk K+ transport system NAD-binding subunit
VNQAPVLLIGDGDLADEVCLALEALDTGVTRLRTPDQGDVDDVFAAGPVARAVVVSRSDAFALRGALMVRHADEDVELLVTYFDPATRGELEKRIDRCRLCSMADIVAPTLAGPCLDEDFGSLRVQDDGTVTGVRVEDGRLHTASVDVRVPHRAGALARAVLRPYDVSAALLFYGAAGLLIVLLVETFSAMAVLGQGFVDAFYGATKTLVTVDPNDKVTDGPKWFKTFIAITMLLALVFEAFFTAGLVNRLVDRRLTGMLGRRTVPRRDHVVVVGMGQVGLQLALLLRRARVGVVAVDDREQGEHVGRLREEKLPVVIGRGADISLLRKLSLEHACALAAVTDDDLENLSIAMAALAIRPDLRVVLRVGDGKLANETRSLFRVGLVRDVHRIAAVLIAAQATGSEAQEVVPHGDEAHLVFGNGRVERAALAAAA